MELKVEFKTITPIYTGDAWQNCNEIEPSSIVGSLRFWFEVICYFSGIVNEDEYNNNLKRFEKDINYKEFKEHILENGNTFKSKIEGLLKQGIPIPAIVFGTTGWKGLIRIKGIEYDEDNFVKPEDTKILPHKNWYLPKKYYSEDKEFTVIFEVEENILDSIFYPLLNFMEKYGYWGGKWNIGFGRLKIEEINGKKVEEDVISEKKEFDFSIFDEKNVSFDDIVKNTDNFNDLLKKEKYIYLLEIKKVDIKNKNNFIKIIKELLEIKMDERRKVNNRKERHLIFGKTGNPKKIKYVPQGSKILPHISKNECGFISIVGVLNLPEKGENND